MNVYGRARILLTIVAAGFGQAATIVYSESVFASGKLGPNQFDNALVTISVTADPSNVSCFSRGSINQYCFNAGVATVEVEGLGKAMFQNQLQAFTLAIQDLGGIQDAPPGGSIVLATFSFTFENYDLSSPLGVQDDVRTRFDGASRNTDLGPFVITEVKSPSEFRATVTVPETPPVALLGAGLSSLLAARSFAGSRWGQRKWWSSLGGVRPVSKRGVPEETSK